MLSNIFQWIGLWKFFFVRNETKESVLACVRPKDAWIVFRKARKAQQPVHSPWNPTNLTLKISEFHGLTVEIWKVTKLKHQKKRKKNGNWWNPEQAPVLAPTASLGFSVLASGEVSSEELVLQDQASGRMQQCSGWCQMAKWVKTGFCFSADFVYFLSY